MILNAAVLLTAVVLMAAVQILVKARLTTLFPLPDHQQAQMWQIITTLLGDVLLWVAFSLLCVAALLWYYGVYRTPLSIAIAYAALTYPVVMLGSVLFLGEKMALVQMLGGALVFVGIILVSIR